VLLREEAAVIVALLGLASVAGLITGLRMAGMDAGPWTDPGSFGFYISTWVVMMAAMMLPSAAPMVLVFRRLERARSAPAGATTAFVISYLVVWGASGLVAYAALKAGQAGGIFAWDRAGRPVAVGALLVAALYEMTPAQDQMPAEMPLAAGISPRLVARRAARRVYYGYPAWRLVPGVLLGADGGAVRARGDEPHLDARGFRADRSREVAAVAQGGDGRRIGGAGCGGDGCGGGPSERALVDRAGQDIGDGAVDGLATGPDTSRARQSRELRSVPAAPAGGAACGASV